MKMENRIYEVAYEVATDDLDEWWPDRVTVLANGDAMLAVQKAKAHAERNAVKPYKDQDGKKVKPKLEGWRLVSVKVIAEAEIA